MNDPDVSDPAVSDPAVSDAPPAVAAFDVDGTLTTRDCVVPFLELLVGRGRLIAGIAAHPLAIANGLLRRDRDRIKAVAIRAAFTGRRETDVVRLGERFAETVHATWMRPDTAARLAWHRDQGHRIVIVSASLGVYLRALGAALGVDAVLCTEPVVARDGRYTGEMAGGNCRGPEKWRRLDSWMVAAGLAGADLWAYGDSAGDREMLAAAQHPFLVKDIVIDAVPA